MDLTAHRGALKFLQVYIIKVSFFLSVVLSACLPACLSVCLSACLSTYLPVCLPACQPTNLPVCLPARLLPVCMCLKRAEGKGSEQLTHSLR
jgi:hypothetical protein